MSQLPSVGAINPDAARPPTVQEAVQQVDLNDFLKLLITELQNQDPLNPLDNAQMLQQLSQIREIGATEEMTDTVQQLSSALEAVTTGQNLATASSLIGKRIKGVSDDSKDVVGVVKSASLQNGRLSLTVDGSSVVNAAYVKGIHKVRLENLREIVSEDAELEELLPIGESTQAIEDESVSEESVPVT